MKDQTDTCGCCEGIEKLTPLPTANRPGLTQLFYRVGTHGAFLETMLARLSNLCLGGDEECKVGKGAYPLEALRTRERTDPAIALLDAWATVADVLTFYQERIANEGYLRTAAERRSILELARLVGYKLRPGVSSSVFFAYTLDENFADEILIPRGARAQSVPGPGEMPQSFETGEELKARASWNNLRPRMTRPQTPDTIDLDREKDKKSHRPRVYLKGITSNLKANDPLLIDFFDTDNPVFYRVDEVKPDPAAGRTLVTLQAKEVETSPSPVSGPTNLIGALTLPPSVQPPNSLRLGRNLGALFSGSGTKQAPGLLSADAVASTSPSINLRGTLSGGEAGLSVLKAFAPQLRETLATAAANADVTEENRIRVYALRVKASLFGHNHPGTPNYVKDDTGMIKIDSYTPPTLNRVWPGLLRKLEPLPIVAANAEYDQVKGGGWAVIERPIVTDDVDDEVKGRTFTVHTVLDARVATMSAQGVSSKVSQFTVDKPWFTGLAKAEIRRLLASERLLRDTIIYAQSEELELAEEPIDDPICGDDSEIIELDGFYEGLESGRWVIVSGEREIEGTSGLRFSELAMLSTVTQDVQVRRSPPGTTTGAAPLAGDRTHSFIRLANRLQYCFKRDTVTIYGNVVKATHGETRREVLGSGDGAKALQTFALRQPPLTFVSAPNPSGIDSTLRVHVNDVQWQEADSLAGLTPGDRAFTSRTDDEGKTSVTFGNGREGARLPTGIENVRAEYRNGIGKPGNVKAGQVTQLTTRPLGVKEVLNPLRASGGADKETRDQARKNAPLAVKALDRLVSVQDYEDFARTYAGIGKARAIEMSDGHRRLVHVTIAGADDIPIERNSDLYRNLRQSLVDFGDPYQAIQLDIRELMLIVIGGRIRIMPEYQWEPVVTEARTALLDFFSFERRELGQDVLLSEVISVVQMVRGVTYVDVDVLRGIPEKTAETEPPGGRRLLTPDEIAAEVTKPLVDKSGNAIQEPVPRIKVSPAALEEGAIRPAQLAFLTPDVFATLILNQIA